MNNKSRALLSSVSARFAALAMVAVLFVGGCENRPEPIQPATGTPAEIFRAEQANIVTTYGEIDMQSVEDVDENRVRFRTLGGELFEVEMETAADGTHRWINSEIIAEPK